MKIQQNSIDRALNNSPMFLRAVRVCIDDGRTAVQGVDSQVVGQGRSAAYDCRLTSHRHERSCRQTVTNRPTYRSTNLHAVIWIYKVMLQSKAMLSNALSSVQMTDDNTVQYCFITVSGGAVSGSTSQSDRHLVHQPTRAAAHLRNQQSTQDRTE